MTTTRPVTPIEHVAPITHREATELARTAYRRLAELIATIDGEEWSRPTDCSAWDVRDLVGHLVGAMRSAASVREMLSQQREIKARMRRDGTPITDTMTQVQLDRTATLTPAELVTECAALVEPATTGRRRTPSVMRRLVSFDVDHAGSHERWRLGYLVDVILTRDAWLHRVDLSRALGRELVLTPDHDGRLVADVVAEWARRHGRPFTLTLTGPAGGTWSSTVRGAGDELELDAVEFCRIVSGRASGDGLLATPVPF